MDNKQVKDQLRRVFQGLLTRAQKDEVKWQVKEPTSKGAHKGTYVVKLPSSALRLDFISPESEPDYYIGSLVNDEGKPVQRILARESDTEDWQLLSALWREAYRATTGWDKALADAEAAVKSPDPLGEDDIPF